MSFEQGNLGYLWRQVISLICHGHRIHLDPCVQNLTCTLTCGISERLRVDRIGQRGVFCSVRSA